MTRPKEVVKSHSKNEKTIFLFCFGCPYIHLEYPKKKKSGIFIFLVVLTFFFFLGVKKGATVIFFSPKFLKLGPIFFLVGGAPQKKIFLVRGNSSRYQEFF